MTRSNVEQGADPTRIFTRSDLARALRHVHILAGQPSLRDVERLADERGVRVSRSTIGRMLRGDKVPSAAALRTFLTVCDVGQDDVPAWLAARERLLIAAKAQQARASRVVSSAAAESGNASWKSDAELIAHILAVGLLPLAEEMLREGAAKRTQPR